MEKPHITYMWQTFLLDYSITEVWKLKEYINSIVDKILYSRWFYDSDKKEFKDIIYNDEQEKKDIEEDIILHTKNIKWLH
jgi:hypothetical protein